MDSTERNLKPSLDLSNPLYKEVFFLVAQFLSGTPCQRAAKALIEELEAYDLIPDRVNWLGEASRQDFNSFSSQFDHVGPNHLPKLLELCVKAANAKCPTSISINKSLLSSSTLSFLSRASGSGKSSDCSWSRRHGQLQSLRPLHERRAGNPVHAFLDQHLTGVRTDYSIIQPDFYSRLQLSCGTLGHLSAVYCVLFDVTGRYVFTGADDSLVKIWSTLDGRLLATLRGASSEITDLAVNNENTMLAAGSCDKLIRVWCLRTCAPLAVLNPHSGSVTSLFFCPMPRSRHPVGYLASTSTDGSCSFWGFTENQETGRPEFHANPTLYQERMRPGHAQMICSSFSSGGVFMAAGSADNNVRVYNMLGQEGPERILEVEVHSDRVDSISWAHEGLRFVSGSKDGTALVWRFENGDWRYVRLHCQKTPGSNVVIQEDPKKRPRVTMVGWNSNDTLVLTAVSDHLVKVWNPKNAELIRVLKAHQDEAYVIESHPFNPRLICTAGHDGRIIIWDIGTSKKEDEGKKIFEHHNQLDQGQGHGAVFDCKWAPDGLSLAATDSHGHLLLFSTQSKESSKFANLPNELFFHTDYRPLTRDAMTHEVLDEQTQVPPHLMPPPFLVDMEGNPYPPQFQRLVPGRENCREEQLIPNVAIGNGGYQEVIEGLPSNNPRSNIDQMIEQLAIEQGVAGENRNAVPVPRLSGGPQDNRERRTVGLRRSGDVEGVRQSTGNWQRGNYGFPERKVVMPLSEGVRVRSEDIRLGYAELEEKWFREHANKRPASGSAAHSQLSPTDGTISLREARARRVRRLPLEAAERRRQAESQSNVLEIEGVARPNPRPQLEISISQQGRRAPPPVNNRLAVPVQQPNRRGQGRSRYRYNVRRIFEERGVQNESDIENMEIPSEEDSSDEEVSLSNSSSSSSDSDSESDWGGSRDNEGRAKRNNENTGSRKSARKSNAASPQSENNQNTDDDDDEPRPGPSSAMAASSSTTTPGKSEPKSKGKKGKKTQDFQNGLEEIPLPYRPSEWLAEVYPKRTPYFPQIGDEIVYYRQGHQQYVQYVEKHNTYEMSKKFKKSLPYHANPDLEAAVPCRVVSIKFELKPPRVVILKLMVIDWETNEPTGTTLHVQYHDVQNIVDFLILRQIHDKYVRQKWNPGDRFRCLIDREWWLGTVNKLQPFDKKFPQSKFLCYHVTWDNNDPERLSPWDMDIITDSFEVPTVSADRAVAATEEEMRSGLYEATATDWPPHGHQDAQCSKLSGLIEQVMGLAISEAFLTPVDINRYPNYAFTIEYPIDLSTIKDRLDSRFYRRRDAVKFDVQYIATNAEKFNRPDSDIVKHAKIIRDLCLELIQNPDVTDVNSVYHGICNNYIKSRDAEQKNNGKSSGASSNGSGPSTSRSVRASTSTAIASASTSQQATTSRRSLRNQGRPGRAVGSSDEEVDDRPWKERCRDLLEKIWQCKDAIPFRVPVNPEEYPDYYQTIDTPMDLQSVREDLLGGNYTSPLDFHKDMNLIFNNSRHYNTDKRSQIYSMTIRLQSMYECQVKPILTSYRSRRKGKNPAATSPQKKRIMPSRASSSTPRKNPKRNAAAKNPYLQYENGESDEEGAANGERRYSTRSTYNHDNEPVSSSSGRMRTRNAAATTTPTSSTNRSSMNGHSSRNGFSPPTSSRSNTARRVKRFRISSGESLHSHRSNGQRTGLRSRGNQGSARRAYVEDEGSDEFEDSDEVPMPQLHQPQSDDDYETNSDQEASRSSLRRSARVQKSVGGRGRLYESDDENYTGRFRKRPVRNYDETQNGSEDEYERRQVRNNKKRRRLTSRSEESPPRKLRRQEASSSKRHKDDEDEEEEEEEEEEDDPDRPGPSSRLLRASATRRSTRRSRNVEEDEEEEADEDDAEEEDDDDDDEDAEVDGTSDGEEDDDEDAAGRRRSTRLRRKPSRHSYSDEDANSSPPRSLRGYDDGGSRRTRRANRPDYAEDSDSEAEVSVSSRGRVRRKKSFLG